MKLLIKKSESLTLLFFIFSMSLSTLTSCKNEVKKYYLGEPPGKPLSLDVKDINAEAGEATLDWKAPTDKGKLENGNTAIITGYVVEYLSGNFSDSSTPKRITVDSGDTTNAILTDLLVGKTYSVRVYAKNAGKNPKVEYSSVKQFTIDMSYQAESPGNPTNLTVIPTPVAITVGFEFSSYPGLNTDGTKATITGYEGLISKHENFSDNLKLKSVNANTNNIFFNDLSPNTSYYIKVFTLSNNTNTSKRKSDGVVYTANIRTPSPEATPPGVPTGVVLEGIDGNSATLTWHAPLDPGFGEDSPATIKGYIVEISPDASFSVDRYRFTTNATKDSDNETYTLRRLLLGQTYYARVFAVNDNPKDTNTSTFAVLKDGFTVPNMSARGSERPGMPFRFTAVAGVQSVKLTWKAPDSYGKGVFGNVLLSGDFEIQISLNPDFSDSHVDTNPSEEEGRYTVVFVDGIEVDTKYYARVRTDNKNKSGGLLRYSPWVYLGDAGIVTKRPTPPDPPTDVKLIPLEGESGKTSLRISWTAPENTGLHNVEDPNTVATIVKYLIYYADKSKYTEYKRGSKDLSLLSKQEVTVLQQARTTYRFTITKLKVDTDYTIFVVAVNDNPEKDSNSMSESTSVSVASAEVSGSTKVAFERPDPPVNVKLSSPEKPLGRTQILLSWDAPENTGKNPDGSPSSILRYAIFYKSGNSNSGYIKRILEVTPETPSNGICYTITGLEAGTSYEIYVVTVNENADSDDKSISSFGVSESDSVIPGSTLDNSEPPETPEAPVLSVFDDGTVNPGYGRAEFDIHEFTGDKGKDGDGDPVIEVRRVLEYYRININADMEVVVWSSEDIDPPTDATTVLVSNLLPDSGYVFRVKVIPIIDGVDVLSNAVVSSYTDVRTTPDLTKPACEPPTPVLSVASYTTIKVSVPAYTASGDGLSQFGLNADGNPYGGRYVLQIKREGEEFKDTDKDISVDSATEGLIFENLNSGVQYHFRVVAIPLDSDGNDISGSKSEGGILDAETSNPGIPNAPENLVVYGHTQYSISLTWDAAIANGSPITGYKVYHSIGTSLNIDSSTRVPDDKIIMDGETATISGLSEGLEYTFAVRATSAEGDGQVSKYAYGRTYFDEASTPSHYHMMNVKAKTNESTYTTMDLSWDVYNGDGVTPTIYKVYYKKGASHYHNALNDMIDEAEHIYTVEKTHISIEGLEVGKEYVFVVVAKTPTESVYGDVVETAGLTIPGNPRNLILDNDEFTPNPMSFTLKWDAPDHDGNVSYRGEPLHYEVFYAEGNTADSGETRLEYKHIDHFGRKLTAMGLSIGETYTFAVYAASSQGLSLEAATHTFTAIPPVPAPDAPKRLRVNGYVITGDSEITLSWDAPVENAKNPITGYEVYYSTSPFDDNNLPSDSKPVASKDVTTTTISNLKSNQRYHFKVVSIGIFYRSKLSNEVNRATLPGIPNIAAILNNTPQLFNLDNNTPSVNNSDQYSGVYVNWEANTYDGNEHITKVIVYYSEDQDFNEDVRNVEFENNSPDDFLYVELPGYNPYDGNKNYYLRIVVENIEGKSKPSSTKDTSSAISPRR